MKAVFPMPHLVECGITSRYVTSPSPQDVDRQVAKCLQELNTDEVCQWFTSIGLQKCLPFIRGKTHFYDSLLSQPCGYITKADIANLIFVHRRSNQKKFFLMNVNNCGKGDEDNVRLNLT